MFFLTQTERMTEQEAHHQERRKSTERDKAHSPKQDAVREEHSSDFQFGMIKIESEFPHSLFHVWWKDKDTERGLWSACVSSA